MFQGIEYDYNGAHVLITGGSNGVGYACAKAYLSAGASVTITGRKADASDYDNDLTGMNYRQLDVSCKEQLITLANSLTALDILVNNAGGTQADEWGHDGFDQSLQVNLASAFHLATACKPLLEASAFSGGASVIGIASMTSYFGSEWTPGYGPAKAGLVQLAKTLGHSWGSSGIRANCVAAGFTRSNLTSIVIDNAPQMVEDMFIRQGIKRVGEADDIAAAVAFLVSDAASYITGETINVNGGMYMV